MQIRTVNALAHGSLGEIHKDRHGRLYTREYYASRYWFESRKEAKKFILDIIKTDYMFKMGEIYLESLEPTKVRGEWTVVVNEDPGQMRMNDITYGG
jgi:hypothetical protein